MTSAKGAKPVRVVHLRGGIPRDDAWLHTPDQPTIISSTVDQVGSRLLFRGYGVTPCMRPVHAGVLARDTLYFLDEVHLATAFEQTLDRLQRTYEDWAELSPSTGRPFQVVCMSATPRPTSADLSIFRLGKDDHKHRVLAKRLGVSRRATLQVVKTKKAVTPAGRQQNRKAIARVASGLAKTAADGGATAIGVVVNRVDTARRIATSLQKNHVDASVLLLTGRMRPYERTEIQATLDKTAASGAKRPPGATPTFVVATSCIEAGADLDFDALITEVASLDALRQRFGRLNRLGNYDHAPAWILAASDQVAASAKPDPIYGTAVRETWTYLNEIAESSTVDFGLRRFVEPELERRKMLLPAAVEAPVLFPSYLDMWSETRPAPHPDPDVSLWLHGKDSQVDRDVNLVFRANVPASEERASDFNERIEFLRPLSEEAVSVPLHELRAWLKKGNKAWAWAWRSEGLEWIEAAKLQPGDTILVDATSGGISQGTWNPESATPVEDVAERAAFRIHGLAKLRVDPLTLPKSLTKNLPFPPDSDDPETLANRHEHCLAWLQSLPARFQAEPETWGDWQPLL
ncbi:MAG: type I-G CRISPR-associated helicase/endonuclease Cas3g, partial [Nannocystaceae bacterium]